MKQLYFRRLYFAAILTLFSVATWAQDMSISGKIVSGEDGAGLPGVSITIKGTSIGTSTSNNGQYSITVPQGATLVFSSVGYTTEEVTVGLETSINIALTLDIMTLSDVVVVGYGVQEKRDVVASISQVKAADFKNVSVPSFDAALQGRATGIQVVQSSGIPGSAVRVRVRGQGSIASNGDPLYVIDGVPQEVQNYGSTGYPRPAGPANNNPLASLNPNDIESVEVLKDAEACAIFGARAGNGAILITTKKGKSGKTTIEMGYYTGISSPTKKLKMLNSQQWATLYNEGYKNDSTDFAAKNPTRPPMTFPSNINGIPMNRDSIYRAMAGLGRNTDWLDETMQSGKLQEANISARGGNEKTRFYVSGAYRSDEGILKGSKFERVSGRLNLENSATDNLEIGAQVNVSFTKNQQVATSYTGGIGAAQSNALPLWPIRNPNGSYFGTQYFETGNNPVAQRENSFVSSAFKTITNLYGNYKIGRGFSFRQDLSLDMYNQIEEEYVSGVNRYYSNLPLPSAYERHVNAVMWNSKSMFTYEKTFAESHKLHVIAGTEAYKYTQKDALAEPANNGVGFSSNYYRQAGQMDWAATYPVAQRGGGGAVRGVISRHLYSFSSLFSRINYKFKDKYILELNLRRDGSSRFGPNKRYGYFPGGAVGWVLSEEGFLKGLDALSFLKMRLSYGSNGSAGIGNNEWNNGSLRPANAYLNQNGLHPVRLNNPALSWEGSRQANLGINFGFLGDRITGSLDLYQKITDGLLLPQPVQISGSGNPGVVSNTELKVRNRGIEFSVSTKNLIGDFKWDTDFNISTNQNRVTDVAGIAPDAIDGGPGDSRILQGYPLGTSYLAEYAGVDPETGLELIKQLNGRPDTIITSTTQQANRKPFGRPFPKFTGGINNRFAYKGFDLSILFAFTYGNTIYQDDAKFQIGGRLGNWNQRVELLDRWQKPGDQTNVPKATISAGSNADINNTNRWLEDGSFLRLRNLQIGYTLPSSITEKARISTMRVFVAAQNLWVWTNYSGWDPEVVRYINNDVPGVSGAAVQGNISFGAPYLPTPQAKTFTFGVNVTL